MESHLHICSHHERKEEKKKEEKKKEEKKKEEKKKEEETKNITNTRSKSVPSFHGAELLKSKFA